MRRLRLSTARGDDSPDGVAHVVGDDERATVLDGDAHRAAARVAVLQEAGHEIDGLARRDAIVKRNEDDRIAVELGRFQLPCSPMNAPPEIAPETRAYRKRAPAARRASSAVVGRDRTSSRAPVFADEPADPRVAPNNCRASRRSPALHGGQVVGDEVRTEFVASFTTAHSESLPG